MRQVRFVRVWFGSVTASWRHRRDDTGGVLDEAAMIAVGFGAAVVIAGLVWALINGIEIDIGQLMEG